MLLFVSSSYCKYAALQMFFFSASKFTAPQKAWHRYCSVLSYFHRFDLNANLFGDGLVQTQIFFLKNVGFQKTPCLCKQSLRNVQIVLRILTRPSNWLPLTWYGLSSEQSCWQFKQRHFQRRGGKGRETWELIRRVMMFPTEARLTEAGREDIHHSAYAK